MADNVNVTEGDGTIIVATDKIGGVDYQRVKATWGADGTANDTSAANPMPVVQTGTPGLATGAATSANQDTGNTSLATLITQTDGVEASLSSIDGKLPALGQALAAASVPVVLPATQITTLTPPAAITGFATESTLAAASAKLPAALGGTTSANSFPVVLSSDGPFATQTGSITETAPATDTASSGLNGRLQRIAQRITSLIALLPTALGANGGLKVEGIAGGVAQPVSIATAPVLVTGSAVIGKVSIDQTTDLTTNAIRILPGGTLTAKNGTITSGSAAQTFAASNSARRYLLVQNQSIENLYISFTGAAVADKTSLRLSPGDTWESPSGFCSTQACSIIGATTGSAFHAVEG